MDLGVSPTFLNSEKIQWERVQGPVDQLWSDYIILHVESCFEIPPVSVQGVALKEGIWARAT